MSWFFLPRMSSWISLSASQRVTTYITEDVLGVVYVCIAARAFDEEFTCAGSSSEVSTKAAHRLVLVLMHVVKLYWSDHGVFFSPGTFFNRCHHLIHRFVGEQTPCVPCEVFSLLRFQHSAVKLASLPMGFYWLSKKPIKKQENLLTLFMSSFNKINLALFMASLRHLFPLFIPSIWPFRGLVMGGKKETSWRQLFICMTINFLIPLSKFTAEQLTCSSWFHSHFGNVMTQFIINKRTDA